MDYGLAKVTTKNHILCYNRYKLKCVHLIFVYTSPEERKVIDDGIDVIGAETSVRYHEDSKDHQSQQNVVELPGNEGVRDRTTLCESDGYDVQSGRPLSPGTLALMCDEWDTTFMAANAPSTVTESNTTTNTKLASAVGPNQLYVEQEQLVLTRLRCFLNRLITCGSIEGNVS